MVTTSIESIRVAAGNDILTTRDEITTVDGEHVITTWSVIVARGTADREALRTCVEVIEAGEPLVIFPEGTRGFAADPAPFKAGLFHLAEAFPEVQLIPAWIDNVQRVMPKGEVVPVPILCSVTFGAPITLSPGEDKRAFLDRARSAVIALRSAVA